MCVWRPRISRSLLATFAASFVICAQPAGAYILSLWRGLPPGTWDLMCMLIIGLGMFQMLAYILTIRKRRLFVATTPSGIASRTTSGTYCVPWDEIRRCVDKRIALKGSEAEKPLRVIRKEILRDRSAMEEFWEAVENASGASVQE